MSSQMVGLAMTRYVRKVGAIAQMSSEDVVRYIAPDYQEVSLRLAWFVSWRSPPGPVLHEWFAGRCPPLTCGSAGANAA